MKYLIRNSTTNVIDMMFDTPITPSPPLEVISVDDAQYKAKMLGSIFIDVNRYKPYPAPEGSSTLDTYWVSDGTNWIDPRSDDEVWEAARYRRDEELADSDWTQLPDADLTPGEITQWATYRANIRNAIANAPVNDPRSAETAIITEKQNRPGRNDADPRRGRGRGNKPVRPNRV